MTKADLPYTCCFTAKGRTYWFFRSRETGRIRLPGAPGDPAFLRKYVELIELRKRKSAGLDDGTFAWLSDAYQRSAEFKTLADATQQSYCSTLRLIEDELGDQLFRSTTRAMLKAVRDDYAATPRKAHKIKQMVSRLYTWAAECDLVQDGFNPAFGLKRLKTKDGEKEIAPWSDPEIAWYIAAAPEHALAPVMIALYTGQRRKDVREMKWNQVQGDLIRVRTSKTHQLIDMPCHPALKAFLDELKKARGTIPFHTTPICLTEDGSPWPSDNAMSGAVRRVVEKIAQMPRNRSMHGLRYAAAARMDEGGASAAAIETVLGHRTYRMAMKYATGRLRAALGIAAMKGVSE